MSIATDTTKQDSRSDTLLHIHMVRQLIDDAAQKLYDRGLIHDDSKLVEPEKSAFDRLKALSLSGMAYGSEEYRACLRAEKPAIQHHYDHNSHHPEFYKRWGCPLCHQTFPESETTVWGGVESNPRLCPKCSANGSIFESALIPSTGIDGMSLLDVMEMIIDWKAATERMKDGGDIRASLVHNTERFHLSPQLASILANTIKEMGW